MNRIIYILTIISAIFLPLNLVVGFFGMNTTSLPFTKHAGGTYNVVLIMIFLGILTSFGVYKWYKRA
jgi:magnesium transporter